MASQHPETIAQESAPSSEHTTGRNGSLPQWEPLTLIFFSFGDMIDGGVFSSLEYK